MVVYRERRALRQQLMGIVATARSDLQMIYDANIGDTEKRVRKEQRLQQLAAAVTAELESAGGDPTSWLTGELNNARLISTMLYEGQLPAFRALLQNCAQDIRCFYKAAKALAGLQKPERDKRLDALVN